MTRRPGREVDDSGAATLEYVGSLMVVAVVVASLVVGATPLGATVMARLCEAFGTTCGAASASGDGRDREPEHACTTRVTTQSGGLGASFLIVDAGADGQIQRTVMSDDQIKVAVSGGLAAGVLAPLGEAQFTAEAADWGMRSGMEAEVAAGLQNTTGAEFTFQDEAAYEEFVDFVVRRATQAGIVVAATAPIHVASGGAAPAITPRVGASWVKVMQVYDRLTGYEYTPPVPSSMSYELGGYVEGAAMASGGVVGVSGEVGYENALGATLDLTTGNVTTYTRVALDAHAQVHAGLARDDPRYGGGLIGDGSVELVVGVTVDPRGQVVQVGFDGAATADGSYALTDLVGTPLRDADGRGIALQATLAVTDANRDSVRRALVDVLADPPTRGEVPAAVGSGLADLMAWTAQNGEATAWTVQASTGQLLDLAFGFKAPAVGGIDLDVSAFTHDRTTLDAWYLGEAGWKDWTRCI